MRQYLLIALAGILWGATDAFAATKLLLHDVTSVIGTTSTAGGGIGCVNGTNDYVFRQATTTQGSSAVTKTFAPTGTAPPCLAQTASGSGQYLRWISPPISTAVTVSGNINYQAGCAEGGSGGTSENAGFRFVVSRWSATKGGIDATIHTSADSAECGGANLAIAAATPTSTAMAVGDRIVIEVQVRNVGGGWGGNSSRTFSLVYDAGAGVYGDTFANFADTVSFSADTDNARALIFSRRWDPFWILALSGTRFLGAWSAGSHPVGAFDGSEANQ